MIRQVVGTAAIMVFAVALSTGCATREGTGQILGGAVGAAAGSQIGGGSGKTAAMIGGTILGAMIGGELGTRMDRTDEHRTVKAFESGERAQWTNPNTGYAYDLKPESTYHAGTGTCRDYTMDAVIDGRSEVVQGTACQQADGSWEIVS
ncbi:MAG: glycine zipper 2TM domain-containing protein [Xanthomonadaceae bacterium]|nr:glycine zipper 2TM domain-containing protein [Xanthomonadaceae bacterium]